MNDNIKICECKYSYECCSNCCENAGNGLVCTACKYQEDKYGRPLNPGFKPILGFNYRTKSRMIQPKVGILTKLLYSIGYHKPFKGDEWKRLNG